MIYFVNTNLEDVTLIGEKDEDNGGKTLIVVVFVGKHISIQLS